MNIELIDYFPEYRNDPDLLQELKEYQKDLNLLAGEKVSIQFTNRGKNHAVLVMSTIFECAHSKIKMFVRNLNGDISNNPLYLLKLKEFLSRDPGNSIEIIFEQSPNPSSKALGFLLEQQAKDPRKVRLSKACKDQIEEFRTYLVNDEKMIHFIIADDAEKGFNKYRCETNTVNYIAILNFDDPKFCFRLLSLYAILAKNSNNLFS